MAVVEEEEEMAGTWGGDIKAGQLVDRICSWFWLIFKKTYTESDRELSERKVAHDSLKFYYRIVHCLRVTVQFSLLTRRQSWLRCSIEASMLIQQYSFQTIFNSYEDKGSLILL